MESRSKLGQMKTPINYTHALDDRTDLDASRQPRAAVIRERRWPMVVAMCGLAATTTFSIVLLSSTISQWTFPRSTYRWIVRNRATVQLGLQLLANALALVHVSVLGILINRATRVYWGSNAVTLQYIQFWHSLCTRTVDWSVPLNMLVLLISYILLTAGPSALWAGALTPVSTAVTTRTSSPVPVYDNTQYIKEYPSEINSQGPILRSRKGHFAFAVGMQMQASLLNSAASATTVDGSIRNHTKMDSSGFTFIGRSYGVGASIGLTDGALMGEDLNAAYSFEEPGFETSFNCMYNESAEFKLIQYPYFPDNFYEAHGPLPNSNDAGPEVSAYFGHGTSAIVAIGVGRDWTDPRRMLGIAAGKSYHHLNKVQCSAKFRPTRFNVSVSISNKNITVEPIAPIDHFETGGNLTHILMRQFELIANDQTNLYVSLVGSSLNNSISNYIIANPSPAEMPLREATLPGLENAFEAMADDMLVAYASAQLMVQEDSRMVAVDVQTNALRPGEDIYIQAIFAVNSIILLALLVETIRTKFWRSVPVLDYLDPAALIVASAWKTNQDVYLEHNGVHEPSNGNAEATKAKIYAGPRIFLSRHDSSQSKDDGIPLVTR